MFKNSLVDMFSEEDRKNVEVRKPILIFDAHNLAYRCLFTSIFQNPEDNEKFFFFKHMFMNSLLQTIKKFEPERVVLAFDSKNSWRYSIYDQYKSNRKIARDKTVIDFEKFFPIFNEFKNDIREVFTKFYILECERAEGDDIISVITSNKLNNGNAIVVSTDKDFHQLLINKNIQQYDPIKQKMVNCLNPTKELDLKIIMGDKSDAIPAIKPRTGIASAESILKSGLETFLEHADNKEYRENYKRNRILIDFNFIPIDITNNIINIFDEYQIKDINGSKIMNFLVNHRLKKIMESWQNYSDIIKALK